jgi:CBS domain-containing protein
MTRDVLVARPETTFRELIRLIEDHHVHALPVVDELRRVIGIVAESDLLVKEELTERHVRTPLQRRGRARLAGTTAGEIMISPVVTIDSSQTLDQAARVLHQRHIGQLPVVEGDGRLIGIVTRSDVLTVFLRSDEDLFVAVQEAIAAVDDSPSCTLSATVEDGVAVLQGFAQLLSQVRDIGQVVPTQGQRHRQIHDDLGRVMDRQRLTPTGQRHRHHRPQTRRSDRLGQQDPTGLPNRPRVRRVDLETRIEPGTVTHLEGAP